MATFHILNFGCRASQADGAALKQQLLRAGLQEAASVEESAVAILNTCTVTAAADAEVRQFVRRIHRRNPQCRILVTGCYAQRAPEEIAQMDGVAWVVGNSHKHLVSTRSLRGNISNSKAENWKPEISGASSRNNRRWCKSAEQPFELNLPIPRADKFWWARSPKNSILPRSLPMIARAPR